MKISFTKKQFKQLLDLVYLGEWTSNASKTPDEQSDEYVELFQYICSFAKTFGYDDILTHDHKRNKYYATREYEQQLELLIKEYDNESFWNELSGRLTNRDLSNDTDTFNTKEDAMKRMFEIVEYYETEFEKNGINNLVVKENK